MRQAANSTRGSCPPPTFTAASDSSSRRKMSLSLTGFNASECVAPSGAESAPCATCVRVGQKVTPSSGYSARVHPELKLEPLANLGVNADVTVTLSEGKNSPSGRLR